LCFGDEPTQFVDEDGQTGDGVSVPAVVVDPPVQADAIDIEKDPKPGQSDAVRVGSVEADEQTGATSRSGDSTCL
jgi:hypothetical protein